MIYGLCISYLCRIIISVKLLWLNHMIVSIHIIVFNIALLSLTVYKCVWNYVFALPIRMKPFLFVHIFLAADHFFYFYLID